MFCRETEDNNFPNCQLKTLIQNATTFGALDNWQKDFSIFSYGLYYTIKNNLQKKLYVVMPLPMTLQLYPETQRNTQAEQCLTYF